MTRTDIAISLKLITWREDKYEPNEVYLIGVFGRRYAIISGMLGRKLTITINMRYCTEPDPPITYKDVTMDEAKMIARYWQVEEACRHFDIDELT